MSADAYALLDGPLAYLARDLDGVVAPATLRAADGAALPLFSSAGAAERHLDRLPVVDGVGWRVHPLPEDDPRAKEEVLRAALANGVEQVTFDPDATRPMHTTLPLSLALGYVIGHKRSSACL